MEKSKIELTSSMYSVCKMSCAIVGCRKKLMSAQDLRVCLCVLPVFSNCAHHRPEAAILLLLSYASLPSFATPTLTMISRCSFPTYVLFCLRGTSLPALVLSLGGRPTSSSL